MTAGRGGPDTALPTYGAAVAGGTIGGGVGPSLGGGGGGACCWGGGVGYMPFGAIGGRTFIIPPGMGGIPACGGWG